MNTIRRMLLFLSFSLLSLSAHADVRRLHVEIQESDGRISKGYGTAFCIGVTDTGRSLWASVSHNFDNIVGAAIVTKDGQKYPIGNLRRDEDNDVSIFESTIPAVNPYKLADPAPGNYVTIFGFGPEYHGRQASGFGGYVLDDTFVQGEQWYHPIPGDSGAPMTMGQNVVGVVIGHEHPNIRTTFRSDYTERQLKTVYAPVGYVRILLTQYYSQQQGSCGPGGCYIYGRPAVIQPRAGITFPVGPPQIVGITQPIPSPRNVPAAQPQSTSIPDDVIQREVSKWLSLNLDKVRGPAGKDGKDGKDGSNEVAKPQLPLKVILSRDGVKIDEQVVQPGEPLILDVRSLE